MTQNNKNQNNIEQFYSVLIDIQRFDNAKQAISKQMDSKTETLIEMFQKRYLKFHELERFQTYDLNDELNCILQAAMLDEHKLVRINKVDRNNIIYDSYCISKTHGFKIYKRQSSSFFMSYDSQVDLLENGDLYVNHELYGFSVLKNHPLFNQAYIAVFFTFLKRIISLINYNREKIQKVKTKNVDIISDMNRLESLGSYCSVDDLKRHVDHLSDYDRLYKKLVPKSIELKKRQDKLLTDLKEYNKPFRILFKLSQ